MITKISKIILLCLAAVLGLIGTTSFFIIIFNKSYHFNDSHLIKPELAAQFGDFFGGFVGTIFSALSVFLLIYTIFQQSNETQKVNLESNFFRMIDYHNQNVSQLNIPNLNVNKIDFSTGRRAFVQFKIQIHRLIVLVREINSNNNFELTEEQIADIVYIVFYYGIEGSWINFIKSKFNRYGNTGNVLAEKIREKIDENPEIKIGRTNQTNLSTYFRNMYNAIKMVDESKILSKIQKEELIKIYRAQLSNPELYVLFFNVLSRFGKKWKDNRFVIKYELFKNIPHDYCDNYIPKDYFLITYEEDEY